MGMRLPLGIVLAVVAALVVASGVTLVATGALSLKKDPAKVLYESINKSNSVKGFEITYAIKNSVHSDQDVEVNGTMKLAQAGEKKRVLYTLELLGSPTTIEIYQAPGETVSCSSPYGTRQCLKVPKAPPVQSPVEQQEQLRKQLEDGVVTLSYLQQANTIGRSCDNISAVYDIQKLASGGQLGSADVSSIKSMVLAVCIDSETGLPLSTDLDISIDSPKASGTVKTSVVATAFSLTVPVIEIPEATVVNQSLPTGAVDANQSDELSNNSSS